MVKESFDQFRKKLNGQAPLEVLALSMSLAKSAKEITSKTREKVKDIIGKTLKSSPFLKGQLSEEKKPKMENETEVDRLTRLLAMNLEPYFRKTDVNISMSMIDLVTLGITEDSEIDNCLKNQIGVDMTHDKDFQYAKEILNEAVRYYNSRMAPNGGNKRIHDSLRKIERRSDIRKVFKAASGEKMQKGKQNIPRKITVTQSCAILRIAAAIDYIERNPKMKLIENANDVLKELIESHIAIEGEKGNKKKFFDSKIENQPKIEIIDVSTRKKELFRIIDKLLQKAENREAKIFDDIGIRFITKSPKDALGLLYQLLCFPGKSPLSGLKAKPGKVKNLTIEPEEILKAIKKAQAAKDLVSELSEINFDHEETTQESLLNNDNNGHTSKKYKAIHITIDLPIKDADGNMREIPVEIQITDVQSWKMNEKPMNKKDKNDPSHESYVIKQLKAIFQRLTKRNAWTEWDDRL